MKRAFIFVLSFALTFSSFFPYIASAESAEPVKVSSDVIRVLSDVVIYSEDDEIKELGKVVRGATLLAEKVENGRVYIQWNEDLAYISEEKVEFIDGETGDDLFPDNIETNGSLIVLEESKVRIPQGDVLATLSKGIEYSFIDSNENGYEILLGNRIGYVDRSNVEEISQDEEPPNEDTDGNPQNNNGESEESIDQDTPQEEAIEENDNSTQHDESVTDDSVEEGTNVDGQAGLDNESKADYFSIQSGEIPFGKYFKVIEDSLTVYDNSTGSLVPIGTLEKGQIYPRVSDYGNWHRIQFGSRYGYVWKESTQPADGKGIKNLNKNYKNSARSFKALVDLTVYDNTSGKLVPFATIRKGQQHPIVSDYGNWYRVDVSGRVGYVNKSGLEVRFTTRDRYFRVMEDGLTVYDNRTGKLVPIGTLEKGQIYPRVSDYGNWHRIQFGNRYGYVWKESTQPASGNGIKNLNKNYKNSARSFKALVDLTVYDNTSGKLVPFATIKKGQQHPVVSDYGNWYRVDVSGRIGYVNKSGLEVRFTTGDRYFRVMEDGLTVYDNRTGKLVPIGTLEKEQVYPRVSDYGNWHRIQFGNRYGYVWKESTQLASGNGIKNLNKNYKNSARSFRALVDLTVYDNTSGKLVPIATIRKGQHHPIVSDYGNWYRVDVSGRIGYVNKSGVEIGFTKNDRYFQVTEDDLTVYDNRSGKLKPIGTLEKGQVYPRVSDYGNWHRIQFGNRYGYVWKESTQPASGSGIKNLNNNRYKNTSYRLRTITDVTVYDNSSGKLIPFAVINKSQDHPVISDYGNWYRIDISGRIGYVNKSGVKVDFLKNTRYFRVTEDNLTVYDNSTGKLISIGTLVKGQEYPRLRDYGNWHEIKFGNSTGYVWKESTEPAINHSLKNVELGDRTNIGIVKTTRSSVAVYDNTGKSLVPFMYINKDVEISYIRDYGNWWEVHIANRIGYIGKTNVKFVRHLIRDVVNPKQNYSYNEMQRDIQTLKQMYPDLIQTQIIGKSVDGRNIYALKLGKGKTEIFFHGSHHAREHITTNLLMEMIDEYAQAYVKGNKIDGYNVKTVLDRTSIWFVPMVNPDGVMLVQEGASSAKNSDYVLKLNNYNRNFRAWKANIRGVDLNRQYPADWENIKNNTGKPAPMNYKGKRPLTEPEVRAVYNFTRSHDFKTAVAYHSTGEIIYWNFHQKGSIYTRDHQIAKMVGNKTGYSLVYPGPNPSGGGYTDWFIFSQKKPGLTIEVSPWLNNRPVPISYFDRIWKQNYSVGLLLANEAYVNRNKR